MLSREDNELLTRTGPGTPMGELWRRYWLPFALASELPGPDCPPVRVRILSENLVAFRTTSGQVGLVGDNCPHRGASLFFGRNEEEGLRCVYHGWKFDVAGNCTDMPNEPAESNFKHKIHHTAYPCVEKAGVLWTYMGPSHLQPELPQMGWTLVPDSHRYVMKMLNESNLMQSLEGDIDNSHVAYAHGTLGGTPGMPFAERVRASAGGPRPRGTATDPTFNVVNRLDTAPRGIVKETDYGIMMGWQRYAGDETYHWHINHWMMPSYTQISANLCQVRVPIDDENSWLFRVSWRLDRPLTDEELDSMKYAGTNFPELIPGTFRPVENKDNDYLIDREKQRTVSVTGIKSVTQQDRAVTESMGAIYDRTKEHLGTSDTVIIAMRRRMLKEVRALMEGREPYPPAHPEVYRIRGCDTVLPRDADWEAGARELMAVRG